MNTKGNGDTDSARGRPSFPLVIPGRTEVTSEDNLEERNAQVANWVQDNIDAGRGSLSRNSSQVFTLIEAGVGDSRVIPPLSVSPTPGESAVPPVFDKRPALPAGFVARGRGIARSGNSGEPFPWRPVEDILPSAEDLPAEVRGIRNLQISQPVAGQRNQSLLSQDTSAGNSSMKKPSSLSSSASAGDELCNVGGKSSVQESKQRITANYLRLKVEPGRGYYEYHVKFTPELDSIRLKKQIMWDHASALGGTINFDGSNLYLPIKLKDAETALEATHPQTPDQLVQVKIAFIQERSMSSSAQFYNILFRQIMHTLGMAEMGKSYYDHRKGYILPQNRLEIWPGFVSSVDEYDDGLMLKCDASFRLLRTQTVLDILEEIQDSRGQKLRETFTKIVVGTVVLTRYNNKTYRIDDVAWDQNPSNTFQRGSETISFSDYFHRHHNVQIKDLTQPLLISRPRLRGGDNVEKKSAKLICLIPELCYMTGLTEEISSKFTTMKEISMFTSISPQQRFMSIQNFVQRINGNGKARHLLSSWGLQVEEAFVELNSCLLKPPALEINTELRLYPAPQNFDSKLVSSNIMHPIAVQSWAILCLPADHSKATRLATLYRQVSRHLGINVTSNPQICPFSWKKSSENFRKTVEDCMRGNPQFLIIILPTARADVYAALKRQTLVERPMPTQMVLSRTLSDEKKTRSIAIKLAMQINCKLGGWLWSLQIPSVEKIMFVGLDAYHDPRGKYASYMGLVATLNGQHTRFFSKVLKQSAGQEIADSLGPGFRQALLAFHEENGSFPDRVLVFRDGVGDGQLFITREHEVTQFTSALQQLGSDKTKFTFTVVQKRSHTRLASLAENGNYENPAPGTVVNHTITRKGLFDFFLVSQHVQKGTVTPTHFIVLEDNSNMQPELIQKFTYAATFMYFNWAGTIRVPAVCMYAHKLAFLVGQYIREEPAEYLNKQLYFL